MFIIRVLFYCSDISRYFDIMWCTFIFYFFLELSIVHRLLSPVYLGDFCLQRAMLSLVYYGMWTGQRVTSWPDWSESGWYAPCTDKRWFIMTNMYVYSWCKSAPFLHLRLVLSPIARDVQLRASSNRCIQVLSLFLVYCQDDLMLISSLSDDILFLFCVSVIKSLYSLFYMYIFKLIIYFARRFRA